MDAGPSGLVYSKTCFVFTQVWNVDLWNIIFVSHFFQDDEVKIMERIL